MHCALARSSQFAVADYFFQADNAFQPYKVPLAAIAAQAGVVLAGLLGMLAWKVGASGHVAPVGAAGAAVAVAAAAYFLYALDITPNDGSDSGVLREAFDAQVEGLRGDFALAVLAWVLVHAASPVLVHGSTVPFCCRSGDEEEEHALVPPTAARGARVHATHSERRRWIAAFLFAANLALSIVIIVYGQPLSLAVRALFTAWQGGAFLLLGVGCLFSFSSRAARASVQLALLIGSGAVASWIAAYQDAHTLQLAQEHAGKHFLVWPAHAANAVRLFGLLYAVALGTLQFTHCGRLSAPKRPSGEAAVALLGADAGSGLGITAGIAPGAPPVSANGVPRSHVTGYGF